MSKPKQQVEHIQTGLRLVRKDYNVSQTVVAKDNNLTNSTLSRIENYKQKPGLVTLLKLLQYYEVSLKEVHEKGLNFHLGNTGRYKNNGYT